MNSEIVESDTLINQELDKISKDLESLARKDDTSKKLALQKIEKYLKSAKTMIETYELEINSLDKEDAKKYSDSIKSIKNRYAKINSEYDFKKNEGISPDELFKSRTAQKDISQMTCRLPLRPSN